MAPDANAIWTPDGIVRLDDARPERVELRPALMEWFAQFSDFAEHFQLGLHCSVCKKDLVARNGDTDRRFSATCGCREFVGLNRDVAKAPPVDWRGLPV